MRIFFYVTILVLEGAAVPVIYAMVEQEFRSASVHVNLGWAMPNPQVFSMYYVPFNNLSKPR